MTNANPIQFYAAHLHSIERNRSSLPGVRSTSGDCLLWNRSPQTRWSSNTLARLFGLSWLICVRRNMLRTGLVHHIFSGLTLKQLLMVLGLATWLVSSIIPAMYVQN